MVYIADVLYMLPLVPGELEIEADAYILYLPCYHGLDYGAELIKKKV